MAQHIKSRKHAVPRKAAGWTGAAAATLVAIAAPAGVVTVGAEV